MIHVLENEGSPRVTKSATNALEMAKDFLSNYQTYTEDSLYGELKDTLENVDASKNVTKISGNTQLEVTSDRDSTTFKWTYTFNGVKAPSKFVSLGFKNGFLSCFVDNWHLYRIGSTSVNLSKEEAIAIALETAKAHFWSLKLDDDALEAKNFNESNVRWTALIFDGSLDADKKRSQDPLMLYPVWRVGIALDKWYGNMYGIEVDIWADTKEVRSVQEAWSTMPPPEGTPNANVNPIGEPTRQVSDEATTNSLNGQASVVAEAESNSFMWIAFPALAAVMIGTAPVWVSKKKKSNSYNLLKPRYLKTGALLLCILIPSILISSTIVSVPIATANPTTRAAVVWGSESTGAYGYPPSNSSWRKSQSEIDWQQSAASVIVSKFAANGYDGYNNQGSHGSTSVRSCILNEISNLQSTHDYVAVVVFDHGLGLSPGWPTIPAPDGEFHYMFEDNVGTITGLQDDPDEHPENGVYDMEIYQRTQPGKICFALINTCWSARITDQGYLLNPPWPGRARGMTFAWTHRLVKDKSTPGFNIAQHISDDGYNDPDYGPQVYIGFPWGAPSLEQNIPYNTGQKYYYIVTMFLHYAVYGDISVNQALDIISQNFFGENFGSSPLQEGFTAYWWGPFPLGYNSWMAVYGNGNIHLKQYAPDYVSKPSVSGPTSGDIGTSYEFSAVSTDPYGHNIQYTFDWGDDSQTVTDPFPSGQTAYASHSWSSGGQYSVTVKAECSNGAESSWSSPHTINIGQLVSLTVYAYNQYGYPCYVTKLYIDGQFVGYIGYTYTVTAGTHTIYVESPVYSPYFCNVFECYYYDGNYDYNNPTTLSVYADKTVTAYYYSYYY